MIKRSLIYLQKNAMMLAMTSPEKRRSHGPELSLEMKENVKEIARSFIFQSRGAESIRDDENLADIHLINSLWALKEGEASGGQLTPVGGKIDEGELPETAALRELVEETHLRAPHRSVEKLAKQEYEFFHRGKNKVMKRKVHYYKMGISRPKTDIPYVLDLAEDKIAEFVSLSTSETRQLFTAGEITYHGRVLKILDCLSPNLEDRAATDTRIKDAERQQVAQEMLKHHLLSDVRRKMQVLEELFRGVRAPNSPSTSSEMHFTRISRLAFKDLYHIVTGLNYEDDRVASVVITEVNELWRDQMQYFSVADVKRAFDVSDFSATLFNSLQYKKVSDEPRHYTPTFNLETGAGMPTINLVFALLADELPGDYSKIRRLAEANPQTHRMLKRMQLLKKLKPGKETEFLQLLSNTKVNHQREELSLAEFGNETDITGMCKSINQYFTELQGTTNVSIPLDQLNEVQFANSLSSLVGLASGKSVLQRPETKYATPKILQWEAKRKLTLLLLLNDALRVRNEFIQRGITPIEELEKNLNLTGVEISERPEAKTEMSLLRKIIVRDQTLGTSNNFADVAKDVFGSAYKFTETSGEVLQECSYTVPTNPATGEPYVMTNKAKKRITTFTAPPCIGDMIIHTLTQGQGAVEIEEYEPLPVSGEKIISNSPGGGGDVRYAKYYIKHVDTKGVDRYKEIQCYVPDTRANRTAEDEYVRKQLDDREFGRRRLFTTKGVRSFMELLYPASIYGDVVREIFEGQHKKK